MIDIENKVYTTVANAVWTSYPSMSVSGSYTEIPSSFPFVSIVEVGNTTYRPSQDNQLLEHHARLLYEINVYSDKTDTRKATAKSIAAIIDTAMQNMKFTRVYMQPTPNVDTSIYRIVLRYEAIVQEGVTTTETVDGQTVTNTTYQMYRR